MYVDTYVHVILKLMHIETKNTNNYYVVENIVVNFVSILMRPLHHNFTTYSRVDKI